MAADAPHRTLIPLPDELRSPRLLLRPYRAEDGEAVFAAVDESREFIRTWMAWVDNHASVADSRDYCLRSAANWLLRSDLSLGIFAAANGRYLGGIGFHRIEWELRAFEVGYWLRADAVGHGYVTEAVRLLVDLAFGPLAARRLELRCDARNDASRRVAERVGFKLEGRLRHSFLDVQGQPSDDLVFSLVPGDLTLPKPNAG